MSDKTPTVTALKASFLRTQIRILSQPLQPSQQWRDNSRERGTLSEPAVREAIRELNRQVRRHNQAVYSALATRHIAEQIDRLYWVAGAPVLFDDDYEEPLDGVDPMLRLGDDICSDESIAKLPDDPDELEDVSAGCDQNRSRELYTAGLEKMKDLSRKRAALQNKLRACRKFITLLEPFKDPQTNIQPNIVTRDSKLAQEIEKNRELAIRVGVRIGALQDEDHRVVERGDVQTLLHGKIQNAKDLSNVWDAT